MDTKFMLDDSKFANELEVVSAVIQTSIGKESVQSRNEAGI